MNRPILGDKNRAKLQKNTHLCKKNAKKFGQFKKKQYFCIRFLIEGTCCLRKSGSLAAFEESPVP